MKETLQKLLRNRPFQPFTVHLSNGETFDVRHPEMAGLLKSNVIIATAESDEYHVGSLLHVANIKANGSASPPA
jgi:hypothetical protein